VKPLLRLTVNSTISKKFWTGTERIPQPEKRPNNLPLLNPMLRGQTRFWLISRPALICREASRQRGD